MAVDSREGGRAVTGRCKDCKHWTPTFKSEVVPERRRCEVVSAAKALTAVAGVAVAWDTERESAPSVFLVTAAEFGCTLFEAKGDFATALAALREGKSVRRQKWRGDVQYTVKPRTVQREFEGPECIVGAYPTSLLQPIHEGVAIGWEDLSATDWEIVEP